MRHRSVIATVTAVAATALIAPAGASAGVGVALKGADARSVTLSVAGKAGQRVRVSIAPRGVAAAKRVRLDRTGKRTVRLPLTARGRKLAAGCRLNTLTLRAGTTAQRTVLGCATGKRRRAAEPQDSLLAVQPGCDFLDPAVCLLPWPNDYFTKADSKTDTKRRLNLLATSMPRNIAGRPIDPIEYNRHDGFSPGTPIVVKVPGLDNAKAFAATGLVPQTDMARYADGDQPVVVLNARTGERHPVWAELDSNPASDAERTLIVRPAVNFTEGDRYIVALRGLKTATGAPIPAGRGFELYRDSITTSNPLIEERRSHFEQNIFKPLADADVARKNLYLAWDFTVASERDRSERMLHMRDTAFAALGDTNLADLKVQGNAPPFTVDSVTQETDARIATTVKGSFTVPCFLDRPGCVPTSRMLFAGPDATLPTAIPGNTHKATFTCRIPRVATPENKARPSLYGHGLLGSQSEITAGNISDMAREYNFVFCATDWYGMAFEDLPSVGSMLVDLSNFPAMPDRVQQGMLAQMFLGRLMVHPQGLPSHAAFKDRVDTERLFYDGNSQGGIIGGALMSVIPDAERGVLGVPGMNYSTLLNRSVDFEINPERPCPPTAESLQSNPPNPTEWFSDPEQALDDTGFAYACPMYASYPSQLERQLLFSLVQQLWDRGEANGYAAHMTDDPYPNTPAHQVLMHVGLGDHQVAQVAAEVQARTIGAAMRPVGVDADRTFDVEPQWGITRLPWGHFGKYTGSVYEVWDTGPTRMVGTSQRGTDVPPAANIPPRAGDDPHEDVRATSTARRQKSDFLSRDGVISNPCGIGPCYARYWKGAF